MHERVQRGEVRFFDMASSERREGGEMCRLRVASGWHGHAIDKMSKAQGWQGMARLGGDRETLWMSKGINVRPKQ